MPLLQSSEYHPEALMADVAMQRAQRNQLAMQLVALQEGLDLPISPALKRQEQGPEQYMVGDFETLPQIATRYYGEPSRWTDIAKANRLEYPYVVVPGQVLVIPQ